MQIDYYKELGDLCRLDYFQFVKTFWPYVSTEKLQINWHIPYLCKEIQYHSERVFNGLPKENDLVVNISPGTSKSTIFTTLFLPWAWTRMPGFRYIGTSFAEDLAFELTVKSRRVVLSPLYQKLFPEIELRDDLNNKSLWSNTLGGDRYAAGTGGNITGRHAHCIGIDDPLDPKGGRSKAKIEEAAKYIKETLPSRKVSKEISWTYMVMQRIAVGDPTAIFLENFPGVKLICLPGEETDNIHPPELREHYVDGLFDPVRLSRRVLLSLKAELGEYGYCGQILQQPIPVGGGAIKTDRIQLHMAPPPDKAFRKIVRFWDKAALADSGDWTVGAKLGILPDGTIWILGITRGQWSTDTREDMIKVTGHLDGKHVKIGMEQEPGSSGIDAVKESIKRLHGFNVTAVKSTGNKLLRMDTFATQINVGNVHTALSGKILEDYLKELRYFPDGSNDDQCDASSGAYTMLIQHGMKLGVIK